jgi:hypothetical protein
MAVLFVYRVKQADSTTLLNNLIMARVNLNKVCPKPRKRKKINIKPASYLYLGGLI